MSSHPSRLQLTWQVTLALYGLLVAGILLDHAVLRQHWHWPVWLAQTLPLLLLVPGLRARRSRSGIWLCFMLMFYFLLYVERAALDSAHRPVYVGLCLLAILLFSAGVLSARWQQQADRLATDPPAGQDDP